MAGSRLEKVGTIFTRISGLLHSEALKWDDRPLWYDIYARFPPFDKPNFESPVPDIKLRHIFYKEDKERAITVEKKYFYGVSLLNNSETLLDST